VYQHIADKMEMFGVYT